MRFSPQRRRLLQGLAAAPLAASLAPWATAAAPAQRLLVLVYLYGGNDGFNTWVPYTDPTYYRVRPNLAVPRDAVLKITDRHGFHPALATLMPAWEARELVLVQGIGYPLVTQQHYRDIEIAFTANDGELASEGWASRALAQRAGDGPAAVALDMLDIREADPMGPFRGEHVGVVQVHHVKELLARRRVADCVLTTNARGRPALARLHGEFETAPLATPFPDEPFGQSVRCAVELARADRSLPVIHLVLNGRDDDKHHSVDTHWEQLKYHGDALTRLAEGLAALRAGLKEIGRWDETLVATYDEFGRSPVENGDRGTHHGSANTHLVLGGRVAGGLLGAAPPVEKIWPIGGPLPAVDTRSLWSTVVREWWGLAPSRVFAADYPRLAIFRT